MRMATLITIAIIAMVLAACERHPDNPTNPITDATSKSFARGPAQPSQAFLAGLQAAFEATEWERVVFQETTRGGAQVAYPRSFPHGEFLQLTVILEDGGPREVPPVEVYVPTTMQSAPGRCVIFKYQGTIEGAEYVIRTFLPVWFDDLDLGAYHHTYEMVTGDDGTTYAAVGTTRFDTPPPPWATPPVEFTLLPHDPNAGELRRSVFDPLEPGDD